MARRAVNVVARVLAAVYSSGLMLQTVAFTFVALIFATWLGQLIGFPLLTFAALTLLAGEVFFGLIFLVVLTYFALVFNKEDKSND